MKDEVTWKSAVRGVLERLPQNFVLDEIRPYHAELGRLFPQNMHVEAKIRQTLQILRNRGELEFLGGGRYRRLVGRPHFSCLLDVSLGENYKSKSQMARAIIEPWAEFNLYCLECRSDDISALPNNTKVADLRCPACETTYQIKSSTNRFGDTVLGGEFETYRSALEAGSFPNLMLVEWDARFSCVFVVQAIHGAVITEERIVPRKMLRQSARRAGYRGCVIKIAGLPRIDLVMPQLRDPNDCRSDWRPRHRDPA